MGKGQEKTEGLKNVEKVAGKGGGGLCREHDALRQPDKNMAGERHEETPVGDGPHIQAHMEPKNHATTDADAS